LRERLEQHHPAFIYLIPTFQNPSAVRYSEEKRAAVAALLDEFGVTLIEDEPYRELTFDGGSAQPIAGRLKTASWIYTGTVSKTLLPGLRVGYLIASPGSFPATAQAQAIGRPAHQPHRSMAGTAMGRQLRNISSI
jgi:2-aminoadipate transaminase